MQQPSALDHALHRRKVKDLVALCDDSPVDTHHGRISADHFGNLRLFAGLQEKARMVCNIKFLLCGEHRRNKT